MPNFSFLSGSNILARVGGTVAESMWWVGRLRSLCGGWLYSDYNASLSSNWTELDWTGTELGNKYWNKYYANRYSLIIIHGVICPLKVGFLV